LSAACNGQCWSWWPDGLTDRRDHCVRGKSEHAKVTAQDVKQARFDNGKQDWAKPKLESVHLMRMRLLKVRLFGYRFAFTEPGDVFFGIGSDRPGFVEFTPLQGRVQLSGDYRLEL
jgi:hypothetical protein